MNRMLNAVNKMSNVISVISNSQSSKEEKYKWIITILYGVILIDMYKVEWKQRTYEQKELG